LPDPILPAIAMCIKTRFKSGLNIGKREGEELHVNKKILHASRFQNTLNALSVV